MIRRRVKHRQTITLGTEVESRWNPVDPEPAADWAQRWCLTHHGVEIHENISPTNDPFMCPKGHFLNEFEGWAVFDSRTGVEFARPLRELELGYEKGFQQRLAESVALKIRKGNAA